jgi:hypothetical protein
MKRLHLAGLVIVLLTGVIGGLRATVWHDSDLDGHLDFSQPVWDTGEYGAGKGIERYPFAYQLLLAPLAALPRWLGVSIWMAMSVLALLALPRAMERLSGVKAADQWPAWLVLMPFVVDNLGLGQSGPLLLWLVILGLAWARENSARLSGLPIGIAALVKVLPVAFLAAPLVLRRARGGLVGLALAIGLFLGAGALLTSWDSTTTEIDRWVREVPASQSPRGLVEGGRSLRYNNQSLSITLVRTLSEVPEDKARGAVRLASLPIEVPLRIQQGIVALMVVLGGLVALRARRDPTPQRWVAVAGLISIGMLAAAPLVWTHYFIWVAPALVALVHRRRVLWIWGILSLLVVAYTPARALGGNMLLCLWLYFVIVAEQLSRPVPEPAPRTN